MHCVTSCWPWVLQCKLQVRQLARELASTAMVILEDTESDERALLPPRILEELVQHNRAAKQQTVIWKERIQKTQSFTYAHFTDRAKSQRCIEPY